jgi:Carboxypeptidase regulatory-like domain
VRVPDRFGREQQQKKTITDDEGRFELSGFPPHEEQQIEIVDDASRSRGEAKVAADQAAGPVRVVELDPIKLGGTGRVVGIVLGDGKPLAGATVTLHSEQELNNDRRELRRFARPLSTTTDNDGRYEFDSVDISHRFFLFARKDGFTDQGTTSYPIKQGETVDVPAIEVKTRAAFVAGIVVDPAGKPVAGVTVSAHERNGGSISFGRRGPPPRTGPDGRFRLEDLPNVPLELMAYIQAKEPTKDRSIHFPARVNTEPNRTDIRIVLDPKLQRPLP